MLQGKKTYLVALAAGLVAFAVQMGYITKELGETILMALGAAGLATLRAAVSKSTRFVLLPLLLLIPVTANAQAVATDKLAWDQPAPDLATAQAYTYKYYPDNAATGVTLTGVTCTSSGTPAIISCRTTFPAFTPGSHTLTITAANVAGESAKSAVFTFTFVVVPGVPNTIRIEK